MYSMFSNLFTTQTSLLHSEPQTPFTIHYKHEPTILMHNRYVTIFTIALPNTQLLVYYRMITMIYFCYRIRTDCIQQHKQILFYLF